MTSFRDRFGRKRASKTIASPHVSDDAIRVDPPIRMIGRAFDTGMNDALASGFMVPSFSQLGEDATLRWLFENHHHGFYVDVGCYYPHHYSNTAFLHTWLGCGHQHRYGQAGDRRLPTSPAR